MLSRIQLKSARLW